LELPVELTRSRSGLHVKRTAVVIVSRQGHRVITEPQKPGRGTYSRGPAGYVDVNLGQGEYAVVASLVMGPRKRVKGLFAVYDGTGLRRLVVKYERLKLRLSSGDRELSWVVDAAVEALGLSGYVRRRNYGRRGERVKRPPQEGR